MRNLIKFFIEHPTIVNLCVLLIVGLGLAQLFSTQVGYFPQVKERFVDITVIYPGATPEEVEEGIILKVEEELESVDGIDRVASTAVANVARVAVELTEEAEADRVLALVKNAVDKINTFPRGTEAPVVEKRDVKDLSLAFAITGQSSLATKKDLAEDIKKDLLNRPGISDVTIDGDPEQEIEIAIDESRLRAYDLTFQDIVAAIQSNNLETFGGEVKTGRRNLNIKANEKGYFARDLANIIVQTTPDGAAVYLKEVATVRDQFKDAPGRRYLGEEETIVVTVFALSDENILDNATVAREYIEAFNAERQGVALTVVEDGSATVQDNISSLGQNGIIGFILVLIVLALFLDPYLAFWVALKIPVAIIGMFLLADFYGMTINVVSLFAFVIVLGILVDDGVVIGENIYQWARRKGVSPAEAALRGTTELVTPVLISLSTTAIAFSLFMFLPTQSGEFFSEMAFVVIAVLGIALLESFFFLPAHLAHSRALRSDRRQTMVERWFNGLVEWLNAKVYQPVLRLIVASKGFVPYLAVVAFVVGLFATFGLMGSGAVGFTFFPNLDDKAVFIELGMPPGTPRAVTLERMESIRAAVNETRAFTEEEYGEPLIEYVEILTGPEPNQGRLKVTYVNSERRDVSSFELTAMIRERAPSIPDAENLVYGIGSTTAVFGKPVSFALRGKDLEALRAARDDLRQAMESREDLKDVSDTDQAGVREILLSLTPAGRRLGLTLGGVMNQVRGGFFGVEAQAVQRGDEEIEIWVRYPEETRAREDLLTDMRIRTPNGGSFPLSEIAEIDYGTTTQVINRLEGEREIRVEANVANISVSAPTAIAQLEAGPLAEIAAAYPSVRYTLEGQNREGAKIQESFGVVTPVILLLMLGLIVINFNSFSQALMTFVLYPFAFIGVILGHWFQGESMNFFSIVGTIALIGVFTNNSLVLISTFNQLLEEGKGFTEALVEATRSRFRPILLTTITTVAGLAPLLASNALSAQFLQGPAIAMAYGLSFGLFNVLLLLPALMVIVNQLRRLTARVASLNRRRASKEEVEPAIRARAYRMDNTGATAGAMVLLLFVLLPASARAQDNGPVLSLADAVTTGLADNPDLRVLGYNLTVSTNNVDPAVAGIGPRIDLGATATFGYADAEVETINLGPPGSENPPLSLNGLQHGIVVQPEASWLVLDGGAGQSRLAQLRLTNQIVSVEVRAAREQTAAGIAQLYLATASLNERLALARENLDLSQDRARRAERQTQYGTGNSLRALQAEVDVSTDSAAIRNLTLERDNLKRRINLLLGRTADVAFQVSAPAPPAVLRDAPEIQNDLSYDTLRTALLANNQQLELARLRLQQSEKAVQLESSALRPTVQLFANATYLRQTDNANFLLENRAIGTQAGVRFNYALYDGGLRDIKIQNARVRAEQALQQRQTLLLELENELRRAYATYVNARAQRAFELRNLPTFRLNYEKTLADFRTGQTTNTEVRAAQLALDAARNRIAVERLNERLAEVELLRISGGLVD